MAGETTITIVGNLTGDPEIRYTPNNLAVANFTIAATPRNFDRTTNDWKDGDTLFLRVSCWRDFAEHCASSLTKGMRVVATGRLRQRSYETKEGEKRTTVELELDEIGPSLRYATASVTRTASSTRSGDDNNWASGSSSGWASNVDGNGGFGGSSNNGSFGGASGNGGFGGSNNPRFNNGSDTSAEVPF